MAAVAEEGKVFRDSYLLRRSWLPVKEIPLETQFIHLEQWKIIKMKSFWVSKSKQSVTALDTSFFLKPSFY